MQIAETFENGGQSSFLSRDSRLWDGFFICALIFLVASLLHTSKVPWVEEDNYYGALYMQGAHNNLRAGLSVTGGVPATLYFGPLPIPADAYYVHHPTLMPLLVTAMTALLGEKEWVAKLVPTFFAVLGLICLWLLVRDAAGKRAGAFAAAFLVGLPMQLHYGNMVDFEPCLLGWLLAALLCQRHWAQYGERKWAILTVLCCVGAMWTDWPGYLFTAVTALLFLRRSNNRNVTFALSLLGSGVLCGCLFLFQITRINPRGWSNLWTAISIRLGTSEAPASYVIPASIEAHFTFFEWLTRIIQGFAQDYLLWSWIPVLAGLVYWLGRRNEPAFRWLGQAVLQMALPGLLYMALLRNWSYVHDWASFPLIGSIAILGGLGFEGFLSATDRSPSRSFRLPATGIAIAMLFALAIAGFRQGEKQRSQLLMLDGEASEPANLIVDVGHLLARTFPADKTLLCNFDPYYSTLTYYAQRPLVNNLTGVEDWATATEQAHPSGGIIWLGAASASEIIHSLPASEIKPVTIDGVPFAIWKPHQA